MNDDDRVYEVEAALDKETADLIKGVDESLKKGTAVYTYANIPVPDGKEGERIRELRKSEGYTTKQFGERLGVKQSTVNAWEVGRIKPPVVAIKAIAAEFGVSEKWLTTGEGMDSDATGVTRRRLIDWIKNMSDNEVTTLSALLRAYSNR